VLVQRLCGICPVSHHLAAAKALDVIVGAGTGDGLTPTGEKMRRLMHYGQMFQSHSLHFFHLAAPDMVFGIDGNQLTGNNIRVVQQFLHHLCRMQYFWLLRIWYSGLMVIQPSVM